jgi:hypothetical protein
MNATPATAAQQHGTREEALVHARRNLAHTCLAQPGNQELDRRDAANRHDEHVFAWIAWCTSIVFGLLMLFTGTALAQGNAAVTVRVTHNDQPGRHRRPDERANRR